MTRYEFADAVDAYCNVLAASTTSGKRTARHNALVGGVAHSAHIVGLAVDIVYDTPPPKEERWAWAERLELRLIVEDDHDHLQPLDWKAG